MLIDDAIARARAMEVGLRGAAFRYARGNGRSSMSLRVYLDAVALKTVLDALEAERNRNKATDVVDLLANPAGDGRNGMR